MNFHVSLAVHAAVLAKLSEPNSTVVIAGLERTPRRGEYRGVR